MLNYSRNKLKKNNFKIIYYLFLIILGGIVLLVVLSSIINSIQIKQNLPQIKSSNKNMAEKQTIVYHLISQNKIELIEIDSDGSLRKTIEEKNLNRLERKIYIKNLEKEKTEKLFSQIKDILKSKNYAGEKILLPQEYSGKKISVALYGFEEDNVYLIQNKKEYREKLPGQGDNWRELVGEFANPSFEEIAKIIQEIDIEAPINPTVQRIERHEETLAGEGAQWGFELNMEGRLRLYGSGNTGAGLIVSTEVISQVDKNKVNDIFQKITEIVKKESLELKQGLFIQGPVFYLIGFSTGGPSSNEISQPAFTEAVINVYQNQPGFAEISKLTEEFSKQSTIEIENQGGFFVDRLFFEYTPTEENKEVLRGIIDIDGLLAIASNKTYYPINNLNDFIGLSPDIMQGKRDISTIFNLRDLVDTIPENIIKELDFKTVQEVFTKIQQIADKTPKLTYGEYPRLDYSDKGVYSEKGLNYLMAYSFPTISWPDPVIVSGRKIFLNNEAKQLILEILKKQGLVLD